MTKGRRPVIPIEERAAIVSHIDYVDEVHIETTPTSSKPEAEALQYLLQGDDWKGTEKGNALEARFAEVGGSTLFPPHRAHLQHQAVQGR